MKHLRYLRYVLRHRWFVFLACCEMGVAWRGAIHDLSKFRSSEWGPYADHFYGQKLENDPAFERAWSLHYLRNPHHWEHWCQDHPDWGFVEFMPEKYRREMVADWVGAGRAISGRRDWRPWYLENKDRIIVDSHTRAWIEAML